MGISTFFADRMTIKPNSADPILLRDERKVSGPGIFVERLPKPTRRGKFKRRGRE